MKQVLAAAFLLTAVAVPDLASQSPTTISYDAAVTTVYGPHAGVFAQGDRLTFSYTLNPAVADFNGSPDAGIFFNAVLSLSVSFPDRAISAVAGASGLAQTFDNYADASTGFRSDQVFVFGGPLSSASALGGEPITAIEVDFLSGFVAPPAVPTMLASDALPLSALIPDDAFVSMRTSSGYTYVHFVLAAPPTPEQQIASLIASVEALVSAGTLRPGQANGITRPLTNALRSLASGRTRPACSQIADFEAAVAEKVLEGALTPAQGAALIEAATKVRAALGC